MSYWTDFRDKALIATGLKNGATAAVTVGNIARPSYKQAVGTAKTAIVEPAPVAVIESALQGFSATLKQNKWIGPVMIAGGLFTLWNLKK